MVARYPERIITKKDFFHTPEYGRLRLSGLAEGVSFLILLGVAMPLKYLAGKPEAVRIVGSAHGVLFIAYVVCVLLAARLRNWPGALTLMALIAAVLPFGPFWFEARLRKEPGV